MRINKIINLKKYAPTSKHVALNNTQGMSKFCLKYVYGISTVHFKNVLVS